MLLCKKCKKELPEGASYCPWCGKAQFVVPRKHRKRAPNTGTISDLGSGRRNRYMVQSPPVLNPETGERERLFLGTYPTYQEAAAQLEPYKLEHITERYNYSLQKIYEIVTATRSYQKLSKSQRDSYAAAWSNWMKALHGQKARVLRTADYQDCLLYTSRCV